MALAMNCVSSLLTEKQQTGFTVFFYLEAERGRQLKDLVVPPRPLDFPVTIVVKCQLYLNF